ncbi:MAG: acetolactate synthase small subunit [Halobacteriales archaeon]
MSGGLDGPGPHERTQPAGRRTAAGIRTDDVADDTERRRAVLSVLVENESGVLAEVVSLFAHRQINIERLVGEPAGDGERSRITFVVEPPHPGIEQVRRQLEKLLPVITVEELDHDAAQYLSAFVDESLETTHSED